MGMRALLGITLLFRGWQGAFCQPSASRFSITGIVLDPSNAAVAGAKVALRGSAASEQQSATADAGGAFRFEGVSPGSYEIQVEHEGLKPATVRLRIGSRAPGPLRIT